MKPLLTRGFRLAEAAGITGRAARRWLARRRAEDLDGAPDGLRTNVLRNYTWAAVS